MGGISFQIHEDRMAEKDAEIARLTELANNLSDVVTRLNRERVELRAALQEIVNNGDRGIHVPEPYDIARKVLATVVHSCSP